MTSVTQESRTERVGAAVTPSEKRRIDLVAEVKQKPVSELMRERSLTAILAEGDELMQRLREPALAGSAAE